MNLLIYELAQSNDAQRGAAFHFAKERQPLRGLKFERFLFGSPHNGDTVYDPLGEFNIRHYGALQF